MTPDAVTKALIMAAARPGVLAAAVADEEGNFLQFQAAESSPGGMLEESTVAECADRISYLAGPFGHEDFGVLPDATNPIGFFRCSVGDDRCVVVFFGQRDDLLAAKKAAEIAAQSLARS